jgi:hypothetical protein
MTIPTKPMLLDNRIIPRAWRCNADAKHSQNEAFKKPKKWPILKKIECFCRECLQGLFLDDKKNSTIIEGVPIVGFFSNDGGYYSQEMLIERGYVGMYAKDEMVEIEFVTDNFGRGIAFEVNLDIDEDLPF